MTAIGLTPDYGLFQFLVLMFHGTSQFFATSPTHDEALTVANTWIAKGFACMIVNTKTGVSEVVPGSPSQTTVPGPLYPVGKTPSSSPNPTF